MAKRTVEVFTAGCSVCDDAVRLVRSILCESCDLQIHDTKTEAGAAKAKRYGVARVPAVVVNGRVADCCQQGGVDESVLRDLGVGTRV
jgi:glutaredoxin 3